MLDEPGRRRVPPARSLVSRGDAYQLPLRVELLELREGLVCGAVLVEADDDDVLGVESCVRPGCLLRVG
jgi:hypothetical protein